MKEEIVELSKNGNIVIATVEGLQVHDINGFISQPADGILYDLNRDEATTLSGATPDNPKWVNDYAVANTIRALKARIEELEGI